jgi:hypothetical protein
MSSRNQVDAQPKSGHLREERTSIGGAEVKSQ